MRKSAKKSQKRRGGKSMRKTYRRGKKIIGGVGPLVVASLALYALHSLYKIPHPTQGPGVFTGVRHTSTLADFIRRNFYNGNTLVSEQTELFNSKDEALKAASEMPEGKVPLFIDNKDEKLKMVVSDNNKSSIAGIPISETEISGNSTIITLGNKEE